MENLDDSENNAKISDSAYSTSCSNSQSRRSRSSKSTHSESNSSGSSGYGGKPVTSDSSHETLGQPSERKPKDKDAKKKKQEQTELKQIETEVEFRLPEPALPSEEKPEVEDVAPAAPSHSQADIGLPESTLEKAIASDETVICQIPQAPPIVVSRPCSSDGFSCVISMHDGVVMYTTSSLTNTIGFPKDMWIGRSFIDFVHPMDHSTFASQITNGLPVRKKEENGTEESGSGQPPSINPVSTMFCRIRRYRGLGNSFGVKDRTISFMPFLLKLSFKNISEEKGVIVYLVIQATPLCSAFRSAHEIVVTAVSFVMRHVSNGNLEYLDHESVPFLGYFPQDVTGKDVLQLYHPEDLCYMRQIYETIMKDGAAPRSKPYRLMAQNGDYLKLETEWSSFVNPWSRKLEFVIAKHHVIEGPANPDVFQSPPKAKEKEKDKNRVQGLRESIVRIMNKVLTKPAEFAKQQMTKRCQDLASFMENLMEDKRNFDEELEVAIHEPDNSYYERDSEMLGGISPHYEYSDSKSSTGTPLSYNQLNFNENLQRFFDSHEQFSYEDFQPPDVSVAISKNKNSFSGGCPSPMAMHSGDSLDTPSSGESSTAAEACKQRRNSSARLTESLLHKHNSVMEKSLVKQHRDCHSSNRQEREKAHIDKKVKKKEHLARCNATFLPSALESAKVQPQSHGQKRASNMDSSSHKHHCPEQETRPLQQHATPQLTPQTASQHVVHRGPHYNTGHPAGPHYWHRNNSNESQQYTSNAQQTPFVKPMAAVPGLIPLYYVSTAGTSTQSTTNTPSSDPANNYHHTQPLPYMMCGEGVIGSPVMVSPMNGPLPIQQQMERNKIPEFTSPQTPLPLSASNYEEACKRIEPSPSTDRDQEERRNTETSAMIRVRTGRKISSCIYPSSTALNRSAEVVSDSPMRNTKQKAESSEENVDRTDGESSYSSFYSSFFKTDSGSAEDSIDVKKKQNNMKLCSSAENKTSLQPRVKRKIEPPWMEQVCGNADFIYKYQVPSKTMDEALLADRQKMATMEQSPLVNEQLGQLYMELQEEEAPLRLTLEESATNSSSSGEDSGQSLVTSLPRRVKRKREYSKLVMIYEEDAPLPPPPAEYEEPIPSTSMS